MKVIILAGGSGTRLWPLSRNRYPKQFIKFGKEQQSLFQQTFMRSLELVDLTDIFILTSERYKFLVMGNIEELGYHHNESNIIIEPTPRSTLPAIYLGVKEILKGGDDTIVVFPSDHRILETQNFIKEIKDSEALVKDSIVTFGITPTSPHMGYGYIELGPAKLNGFSVKEFKEKPSYDLVLQYIKEGYLWNSGIFMFDGQVFIEEVKMHAQEIYIAFEQNINVEEIFSEIQTSISIDYGILEKSNRISVVVLNIAWNDLGSFDSLYDIFDKDKDDNVIESDHIVINSDHNFINTTANKLVTIIGVDNLIIVDNKDALLVCKKNESQKVKEVVEILKQRNDSRLDYHVQDYRPWGNYVRLDEEQEIFKVKKISVSIGHKLSYQLHHHRSEHWIVVKGKAKVTIEDVEKLVFEGESIYIKAGQKHQLENPGSMVLEIIEVQIGDYLEDDDIIRFS